MSGSVAMLSLLQIQEHPYQNIGRTLLTICMLHIKEFVHILACISLPLEVWTILSQSHGDQI